MGLFKDRATITIILLLAVIASLTAATHRFGALSTGWMIWEQTNSNVPMVVFVEARLLGLIVTLPVAGLIFDRIGANRFILGAACLLLLTQASNGFALSVGVPVTAIGVINGASAAGLSVAIFYALISQIRTSHNLLFLICAFEIVGELVRVPFELAATAGMSVVKHGVRVDAVPITLALLCVLFLIVMWKLATPRYAEDRSAIATNGDCAGGRIFTASFTWLFLAIFLGSIPIATLELFEAGFFAALTTDGENRALGIISSVSSFGALFLVAWLCLKLEYIRLQAAGFALLGFGLLIMFVFRDQFAAAAISSVLTAGVKAVFLIIAISIAGYVCDRARWGLCFALLVAASQIGGYLGSWLLGNAIGIGGNLEIATQIGIGIAILISLVAAACTLQIGTASKRN